MAYSFNTSTSQITVTSPSTVRALYDNVMTTFAGSSYMQYLLPLQGNVLNSLYTLINGWTFDNSTSISYLNTGALQDFAGNNLWDNVQTLGAISNGTLLYSAQGTTVSYLGHQYFLNGSLNGSTTNVMVTKTVDASEPGTGYLQIDSEVVSYGGYNGLTFTSCTRGTTSMPAVSHLNGATVFVTGHVNGELQVKTNGVSNFSFTTFARKFQQTYSQFSTTGGAIISNVPLATTVDPNLTVSTVALTTSYTDMTIKWETLQRSAFDGTTFTKYTVNGALSSGAGTVPTNENVLPAYVAASGSIQIDSEVITYSGLGAKSFTGCTRGQYDTTAAGHSSGATVSTNTQSYATLVRTSNSARRITEAYNWVQYELLQVANIDSGGGSHLGYITSPLVAMAGPIMTTQQGVWIEGFASTDSNNVIYTDTNGTQHTPPLTVSVVITTDASMNGGQVYVATLNSSGLNDATYTPANVVSTLINQVISSTSTSIALTYTVDTPVRVVVRKPGYQQFSLYTTITSAGLATTSQNPVDSAY